MHAIKRANGAVAVAAADAKKKIMNKN